MVEAIKAYDGADNSVIYEYSDGKVEKWSGGTRTWRNQNPGNIIYVPSNDWLGQIGKGGRFCVFKDIEFGRRATRILISNHVRRGMTLEQSVYTYAPPNENNTEVYLNNLETWTGVSRKTKLNTLNESQIESIVQGIFRKEGYKAGDITVVKKAVIKRSGKYIWRTEKDEKVRGSHAKRDGQIFDYSNPPVGGNPGEDYNCRCWAEPVPDKSLETIFKK